MIATKEEFGEQFRSNVKRLMQEEGVSVTQLARECEVPLTSMRSYVYGYGGALPNAYILYRMSVFFGCDADELLL